MVDMPTIDLNGGTAMAFMEPDWFNYGTWRFFIPYGAKKRPRLGRCWSSLPSSLRLCRLRCSSSSSRSLAG